MKTLKATRPTRPITLAVLTALYGTAAWSADAVTDATATASATATADTTDTLQEVTVTANPAIHDNPSASTHLRADTAPGKIDKSVLTISETRRFRDTAHLKFVASQPCLVCGRSPADAHHLRFTQPRGMGLKVSDEFTVPLCRTHHRDLHGHGDEVAWWERRAIEPIATARVLWISTRRIE